MSTWSFAGRREVTRQGEVLIDTENGIGLDPPTSLIRTAGLWFSSLR